MACHHTTEKPTYTLMPLSWHVIALILPGIWDVDTVPTRKRKGSMTNTAEPYPYLR